MSEKTAYVSIKYIVSWFQKSIAPNCGRSRFWENQIFRFLCNEINILEFWKFWLECWNMAYTCHLALENNIKRKFWKKNQNEHSHKRQSFMTWCITKTSRNVDQIYLRKKFYYSKWPFWSFGHFIRKSIY